MADQQSSILVGVFQNRLRAGYRKAGRGGSRRAGGSSKRPRSGFIFYIWFTRGLPLVHKLWHCFSSSGYMALAR
jgi:hypothetical protein